MPPHNVLNSCTNLTELNNAQINLSQKAEMQTQPTMKDHKHITSDKVGGGGLSKSYATY